MIASRTHHTKVTKKYSGKVLVFDTVITDLTIILTLSIELVCCLYGKSISKSD